MNSMNVLGIGSDIIECLRIAQMIERHGELFVHRVYTETEIEFCSSRKAATQHYAGRWAGKEAVLRAIGVEWVRGIAFRDIEILDSEGGRQVVGLTGEVREWCRKLGIEQIQISVSHCRSHATAYALALGTARAEED
jgi:holo-[acyl-carrier protein] synthase